MHPFVPTFTMVSGKTMVPVRLRNPDSVWGAVKNFQDNGRLVLAPETLSQDLETVTNLVDRVSAAVTKNGKVDIYLVQGEAPSEKCLVSLRIFRDQDNETLEQHVSLLLQAQAEKGAREADLTIPFVWVPNNQTFMAGTGNIFTEGGSKGLGNGHIVYSPMELDVERLQAIMTSVRPLKLDWEVQLASAVVHFVDAVVVHNDLLRLLKDREVFNVRTFTQAVTVLSPTHVYVPLSETPLWVKSLEYAPRSNIGSLQGLMDQTSCIEALCYGTHLRLNTSRTGFPLTAKASDTRTVWTAYNELVAPMNLVARRALRRAPGRHIANCVLQCFVDVGHSSVLRGPLYTAVLKTKQSGSNPASVLCIIEVLHLLAVHNMVEVLTDATTGTGVVLRQRPHLNALLTLLSTLCVSYVHLKAPFSSVSICQPRAQVPGGPSMDACSVMAMVLVKLVASLAGPGFGNEKFSFFLYTNMEVLHGFGTNTEVVVTDFDAGTKTIIWKGELDAGGGLLGPALQVVTKLLFAMGVQGIVFRTHDVRSLYGNSLIWKAGTSRDPGTDVAEVQAAFQTQTAFMREFWGERFIKALDTCTCATAGGDPAVAVNLDNLHPDLEGLKVPRGIGFDNQRRRKHTEALWRLLVVAVESLSEAATCPLADLALASPPALVFQKDVQLQLTPSLWTGVGSVLTYTRSAYAGKSAWEGGTPLLSLFLAATRLEKVSLRTVVQSLDQLRAVLFHNPGTGPGVSDRLLALVALRRDHALYNTLGAGMKFALRSGSMVTPDGAPSPMLLVDGLSENLLKPVVPAWNPLHAYGVATAVAVKGNDMDGVSCVVFAFLMLPPEADGISAQGTDLVTIPRAIISEMNTCVQAVAEEVVFGSRANLVRAAVDVFTCMATALLNAARSFDVYLPKGLSQAVMGVCIVHPSTSSVVTVTDTNMRTVCVPASAARVSTRGSVTPDPGRPLNSIPIAVSHSLWAAAHVMAPLKLAEAWCQTPVVAMIMGAPCFGAVCVRPLPGFVSGFGVMDRVLADDAVSERVSVTTLTTEGDINKLLYRSWRGRRLDLDAARATRLLRAFRTRACCDRGGNLRVPIQVVEHLVATCVATATCAALKQTTMAVAVPKLVAMVHRGDVHASIPGLTLFPSHPKVGDHLKLAVGRLRAVMDTTVVDTEDEAWKETVESVVLFRLACMVIVTSRPRAFEDKTFVLGVGSREPKDELETAETTGPDDERSSTQLNSLLQIQSTEMPRTESAAGLKYLFLPTAFMDIACKTFCSSVPHFLPGHMGPVVDFMQQWGKKIGTMKYLLPEHRTNTEVAIKNTLDVLRGALNMRRVDPLP